MSDCKEFLIGVMTIAAIPVKETDDDNTAHVVNQLTPYIKDATIPLDNAVVFGLAAPSINTTLVPIVRMTGKAKDDESDSVAGRLHTVTVTCEVDPRGGEVWEKQLDLERNAHHLLLTFRDGTTQAFVSATKDTYLFTVERDGAKVSVKFRIQNLMGIQQLVRAKESSS